MTSAATIKAEREERERVAAEIAATLPPGNYHAFNNTVVNSDTREIVHIAASHWDACLVMLATGVKTNDQAHHN